MMELSVGEQRYNAVMAVVSEGRIVTEVARDREVSGQTIHAGLAHYEREGMEGMGDRSHRSTRCPRQMPSKPDDARLRRAAGFSFEALRSKP